VAFARFPIEVIRCPKGELGCPELSRTTPVFPIVVFDEALIGILPQKSTYCRGPRNDWTLFMRDFLFLYSLSS
jgi:hypothetical protein